MGLLLATSPAPDAAPRDPGLVTVALVAVGLGVLVGAVVAWLVARRRPTDSDAVIRAALEHAAVLAREQLGAQTAASHADLGATKDVIAVSLDHVRAEMRDELHRLSSLVHRLGQMSAERFGQVDRSLQEHARVATALTDTTRSLREVLSNPQARGQWGERMADDVLRLAGMAENVSYVRQRAIVGRADGTGAIPDYTFLLPNDRVLHMDVKFPLAAYVRHLEAVSDLERAAHLREFLRDVRLRVRELASRRYAESSDGRSVDFVVLFLPNEHLAGFVHEHDPELIDMALQHKVVMCSPLTLYAFLGVLRQAHEQFVVERTSDQILELIGVFDQQWLKFVDSLDGVKRRLDGTQRELEAVLTTRRRALERPLRDLEALRQQRQGADRCDPDTDLAASAV